MIELYAITRAGGPALPAGDGLEAVEAGALVAVCGPAHEGEPDTALLWRHEETVEALMRERDLLPVRWGTRLADPAAAAAVLMERHDELCAALDRVRGMVELSVRVIHVDGPADADRRVHQPLALLAHAGAERAPRLDAELMRGAYLVPRDAVPSFTRKVRDLQRVNPGLRLLCTGPWPPYSFAQP